MEIDIYESFIEAVSKNIDGKLIKDKSAIISKILKISQDSAYNKLIGRSKFTFEETMHIASTLNISIDGINQQLTINRSYVPFHSDGLMYNPREYSEYFTNMSRYFRKIHQLTNIHGHFVVNEIPIFHLLGFKNLLYLKLFIWNKVNWNVDGISKEYDPIVMNHHLMTTEINILGNYYNSFRSTEIWNPYMVNTLISQFNYLLNAGFITNPSHIKSFKDELIQLVDHLEYYTESGVKRPNLKNEVFSTEILYTPLHMGSELILVTSDELNFVFHQLDIPNYIRSNDERYIKKLLIYYSNIKKTTNNITNTGEAVKMKLFKNMRLTIEQNMNSYNPQI